MAIQAPRGTRDFYPDQMALRNWLFDAWRRVSLRCGFEEVDAPAFESLELYTAKSGEGIVSELFRMTDRGGRELALRPELTPSLARMVNQRAAALRLPIKWFAVPRLWRAERPQAGRLREFFQWNIDIVGAEERLADAECIYVAVDLLRELGLGPGDVVVKISSRPLLGALLVEQGVPASVLGAAYALIDKRSKVPADKLTAMLGEALAAAGAADSADLAGRILEMAGCDDLDALPCAGSDSQRERADLQGLFALLGDFGVADYCAFDLGTVRGLDYYTGPVFEVYDRQTRRRAIAGGGRYDSLLAALGGPRLAAVGFGMGDVVLIELLADLGKLPTTTASVDYFLIDADGELLGRLLELADGLRRRGASAVFSYRRATVSKQFKQAAQRGARRAVVVGQELARGRVTVKDLSTGRQVEISLESLLNDPHQPIDS